jgi:signal transduction histidine kinase
MNEQLSSLLECSTGRDTLRPATRNIVETVERVIRMTSVRQEFRRITIKHHHEGTGVGWFDNNRLERVITNLVLHACEAVSTESGQIVITTLEIELACKLACGITAPASPDDSEFRF